MSLFSPFWGSIYHPDRSQYFVLRALFIPPDKSVLQGSQVQHKKIHLHPILWLLKIKTHYMSNSLKKSRQELISSDDQSPQNTRAVKQNLPEKKWLP